MRIVALVFMSNHYHLLVVPKSEAQLARFMGFVNTNLSKQLGRLHGWSGPMFDRRYRAIPVSDEEAAQVERLRYLLAHGTKEGLVACPSNWPGVHCVKALTRGPQYLRGVWTEQTAIWKAAHCGKSLPAGERLTREVIDLAPLPAWQNQSTRQRRAWTVGLVRNIAISARAERKARRREPIGERRIRAQSPHDRARTEPRSPAPIAHAASFRSWRAMKDAYRDFSSAYRDAAERVRNGLEAQFPEGCFPPRGPFLARAGPPKTR